MDDASSAQLLAAVVAISVVTTPIVWKAVEFVKYVRAKEWNGVLTQTVVWVVGTFVVFVLAQSDFASSFGDGATRLDTLNGWTLLLIGLMIGSTASVAYDLKKSIDGSDTASSPALLTGVRQDLQATLTELGTVSPTAKHFVSSETVVNNNVTQPVDYTQEEAETKPS